MGSDGLGPCRFALVAALLAFASAAPRAAAVSPQQWQSATQGDLEKGEADRVSVTPDGRLVLSPMLDLLWKAPDPYIFALLEMPDGKRFVGTGSDGVVYRLTPGKEAAEHFRAEGEMNVTVLAQGPGGTLLAGTAPDGKLYRIQPDGSWDVLFDPESTYIWAAVVDTRGNTYLGTGEEGKIFRVSPTGEGSVFYDSTEMNITSLAMDARGNLLAGGDGSGLVYRISPEGEAFVLYDSPLRQITAIAAGPDGGVYASAVSAPAPVRRSDEEPKKGPEPPSSKDKSEVVRIAPGGAVEKLWESDEDTVFSLAWTSLGLLAGTGKTGRVYMLDADGGRTLLASTKQTQVTQILVAASADGAGKRRGKGAADAEILIGTSNLGQVLMLRGRRSTGGEFVSAPLDAKGSARWGSFHAATGPGTVRFSTRSGNTEKPDRTWSPWAPVAGAPPSVASPPARSLQWKAELAGDDGKPAEVRSVTVTYLAQNVRPRVRSIEVAPHGYVFDKEMAVKAIQEPDFDEAVNALDPGPGSRKPYRLHGWQTLSWKADDDNDDPLRFRLTIRAEDEDEWQPLSRDPVTSTVYMWDSTSLPDGRYVVRVEASDDPANPPDSALRGTRDSAPFLLDNTPPRVEPPHASRARSEGAHVEARAEDALSPLADAEYSIDGGPWTRISPADGIHDEQEESYSFDVPAGGRVLVLRVHDTQENTATGRVILPGGKE